MLRGPLHYISICIVFEKGGEIPTELSAVYINIWTVYYYDYGRYIISNYTSTYNCIFCFSPQEDSPTEELARPAYIDPSFIKFITENLLAYTEIFQLIVPRFLRLDLTAYKNAVMLFRLTKVINSSINIMYMKRYSPNKELHPIIFKFMCQSETEKWVCINIIMKRKWLESDYNW